MRDTYDEKKYGKACFIDREKAFDTENHKRLLSKLDISELYMIHEYKKNVKSAPVHEHTRHMNDVKVHAIHDTSCFSQPIRTDFVISATGISP